LKIHFNNCLTESCLRLYFIFIYLYCHRFFYCASFVVRVWTPLMCHCKGELTKARGGTAICNSFICFSRASRKWFG